jgi:threonine dehydrogenase-like Zn-dependent dehydrogenase
VRGAFHYDRAAVRDALELLRSGGIDAAPLITHRLPLSELDAALALAACGDAIKVAVRP